MRERTCVFFGLLAVVLTSCSLCLRALPRAVRVSAVMCLDHRAVCACCSGCAGVCVLCVRVHSHEASRRNTHAHSSYPTHADTRIHTQHRSVEVPLTGLSDAWRAEEGRESEQERETQEWREAVMVRHRVCNFLGAWDWERGESCVHLY